MSFEQIIELVKQERLRQDDRYGIQRHDDWLWFTILKAELKELHGILGLKDLNRDTLISYIVQIIAVGFNWLEHI